MSRRTQFTEDTAMETSSGATLRGLERLSVFNRGRAAFGLPPESYGDFAKTPNLPAPVEAPKLPQIKSVEPTVMPAPEFEKPAQETRSAPNLQKAGELDGRSVGGHATGDSGAENQKSRKFHSSHDRPPCRKKDHSRMTAQVTAARQPPGRSSPGIRASRCERDPARRFPRPACRTAS